MMRDEAHTMLDEGRRLLDAAGWTNDGERRGGGYWFVLGRRGERLNITLEWSGRWDVFIMIGAHELVHCWSDDDPKALLERATQNARKTLRAELDMLDVAVF